MTLITVSKPSDTDPKFNTGLYWVQRGDEKRECWTHRDAMKIAADMSTGREIIADYTDGGKNDYR